jgi:FecR protein
MSARLAIIVTTAVLAGTLVLAQDGPPNASDARDPNDAPGRAAQLSYLSGTVSFQAGGVEEWTPARLNRPLTTGDRLWTEGGSRAELQIGSAAIRLNGRTNFQFVNLNDDITQIQISMGVASVRIRRLDERESFEIDTPQAAFSLLRPGEYRVDVDE